MTLSGKADARLLLSMVSSGEPLIRSGRLGFFLSRRLCELRRRRMVKTKVMNRRSVVAANAEKSCETMMTWRLFRLADITERRRCRAPMSWRRKYRHSYYIEEVRRLRRSDEVVLMKNYIYQLGSKPNSSVLWWNGRYIVLYEQVVVPASITVHIRSRIEAFSL